MAGVVVPVVITPRIDDGKLSSVTDALKPISSIKLKIQADEAAAEVAKLKAKLAELKESGQGGSEAAKQIREQLKTATVEAKNLADQVKRIDSLKTSASGGAISGLVDKFKEGQAAAGQGGGIFGSVASSLGSLASPIGAATAALGALGTGISETIKLGSDFETGMQALSAVTGLTGAPLEDLGNRARDLAKQFGGDAKTQISAFQGVLSKFGADLASQPEQLGKVSESINLLAKAGGLDAATAMDTLANSQLQFGANSLDAAGKAEQSAQFINVLAASARVGAAEIPQVGQAVLVAGVAAKGAKVSFEETNAAIQVLAAGGKVGAEAGTALRNVLGQIGKGRFMDKDSAEGLKQAGVDMSKLSDKSIPLSARLGELKKIMSDSALVTKVFGAENASAASILIDGSDTLKDWTEQMTGTQDATVQAAKNMNTFSERMSRIKASIEDIFIGAFTKIGPILNGLVDNLGGISKVVGVLALGFGAYTIAINASTIATTINTLVTTGWTAAVGAARTAFNLLKVAMATNPFGAIIAGLTIAIGLYAAFHKSQSDVAQGNLEQAQANQELIKTQIDDNNEKQKSVLATRGMVEQYKELASKASLTKAEQDKLKGIQQELDKQYPNLIDLTKSYKDNLQGVEEIGRLTTKSLEGLVSKNAELNKQMQESTKTIALAKRDVAVAALNEAFDSLDTNGWEKAASVVAGVDVAFGRASASAKRVFDNLKAQKFDQQIFAANTPEQLDAVEARIREFLNSNAQNIEDGKIKLDIETKLQAVLKSQRDALVAYGKAEKDTTEVVDTEEKKKEAAKAKQDKTEFQRRKAQLDDFARIEGQKVAVLQRTLEQQAAQSGLSELTAEQQKQLAQAKLLAAENIAEKADKILLKDGNVAIKLDAKKGETASAVKEIVSDAQDKVTKEKLELNKIGVKKGAHKDFFTEFEKGIKDNINDIKGIISVDELLADTKNSKTAQRQIESLVDLARQLENSGQFDIAADTKKQAEELQQTLTANLQAAAFQRREIEIGAMRDGAAKENAEKLLALDKQYADELKNATKVGQDTVNITKNYEDKRTAILRGSTEERLSIAIQALEKEGARKIAAQADQLIKERDALLASTTATEEQKAAIKRRFDKAIGDLLSGNDDETTKRRADLDKQEADLATSFKKRELTYEEFRAKLSEIEKARQKDITDVANDAASAKALFPEFDATKATESVKKSADSINKAVDDSKGETTSKFLQLGIGLGDSLAEGLSSANATATGKGIANDVLKKNLAGILSSIQDVSSSSVDEFGKLELASTDSLLSIGTAGAAAFGLMYAAGKSNNDKVKQSFDDTTNVIAGGFDKMATRSLDSLDALKLTSSDSWDALQSNGLDAIGGLAQGASLSLLSIGAASKQSAVAIAGTYDALKNTVASKFKTMADSILSSLDILKNGLTQSLTGIASASASLVTAGISQGKRWGDAIKDAGTAIGSVLSAQATAMLQQSQQGLLFALKTEADKTAAIQQAENEKADIIAKSNGKLAELDKKRIAQIDADLATMKKATTTLLVDLGLAVATEFVGLLAQGENLGKAALRTLLDFLDSMVPVITAMIFGITAASPANIASLGTWGAVEFIALTATLKGLVALAKAQAFEKGGLITGGQQLIQVNERGQEFMMNHKVTAMNLPAFTFINQKGISVEEYAFKYSPNRDKFKPTHGDLPTLKQIEMHLNLKTEVMERELTRVNRNMEIMQDQLKALNVGVRRPGEQTTTEVRVDLSPDFERRQTLMRRRQARR